MGILVISVVILICWVYFDPYLDTSDYVDKDCIYIHYNWGKNRFCKKIELW